MLWMPSTYPGTRHRALVTLAFTKCLLSDGRVRDPGGQQHPGECPDDTTYTSRTSKWRLKHTHRPAFFSGDIFSPSASSRASSSLFIYCPPPPPPGSGGCMGFLAALNFLSTTYALSHGPFIPFAAAPSKQGPSQHRSPWSPTASHTCCRPQQGLSLGGLKGDVADLHSVLGHTPNWTRNAFPPRSPAPGMLATPVRQVCLAVISQEPPAHCSSPFC